MSGRAEFFLGIIAIATLSTAIVQIGVLVAAGLLFRRIQKLIDDVEIELRPVFASVQSIARDAARATSLAAAQVERVERGITDLARRVDSALSMVHGFAGPLKGLGWLSIVRTVFRMVRDVRSGRRGTRGDEEDALFI